MIIGVIGGTGAIGSAIGARLARGGSQVVLGSRDREKSAAVVREVLARFDLNEEQLIAGLNSDAAGAEVVIVSTPWSATLETLQPLVADLAGKLMLSTVNRLTRENGEFVSINDGTSAAELIQSMLPNSYVAIAFNHVPAPVAADPKARMNADVIVCANDEDVRRRAVAIVETIDEFRGVEAGTLQLAKAVEEFAGVIVTVNRREKRRYSVRLVAE